jgi:hypothetical protein
MKPTTDQVIRPTIPNLSTAENILCHDNSQKLELELQKVVETLDRLVSNGTLEKGSSLANTFEKFVSANEGRLAKIKAQKQESTNPGDDRLDWANRIQTLAVIESAISDDGQKRTLVHVKDVQRSVASALKPIPSGEISVEAKDGFEEEVEHKEKAGLMAFDSFVVPRDS